MAENDGKKKPQVKHFVSNAPKPTTPVGTSYTPPKPKLTQMPRGWQPSFPTDLVPQATVIIGKALKKFRVQTKILQLCKHVISKLTPLFCAKVRARTLTANSALVCMEKLLHSLLVYNCERSSMNQLEQETIKSDEWMKLANKLAKASSVVPSVANGADMKDRRAATIDAFIEKVWKSEQRKITRRDIWTLAGYKDPTQFEHFQRRGPKATNAAEANIIRVLNLTPQKFIENLDKKLKKK